MHFENLLIVDDEPLILHFLKEFFSRKKIQVQTAENGKKALALLKSQSFDLVITDMKLGDISGLEVLKGAKESKNETVVIVMTAFGTIDNAVEAMKQGAFHYILKPFTPDQLEMALEKAKEHTALVAENSFLRKEIASKLDSKIIAASPLMKKIMNDVAKIAKSNASVFVHGESGTGKELIAGALHRLSYRSDKPYIRVNCAAIPETLVESEFFGHEKGSFTGAQTRRLGRFELADKGTLFLDEVTEIPISLQPKLLRAIQEQEFERIGSMKSVNVDVRFISSSNRDLKKAIVEKVFREDLYYRLNVIPLYLPPLRERKEDIIPLSTYFLDHFCKENHKRKNLSKRAEEKLLSYNWPGNIRELANIIERAVVLDDCPSVDEDHIYL